MMNESALSDLNSEFLFNSARSVPSIFLVTLGSRVHDLFMSIYGSYDLVIPPKNNRGFG